MLKILDYILTGCAHNNVTRPFTIKGETYKVCLDCAKKLDYDLSTMKVTNGVA